MRAAYYVPNVVSAVTAGILFTIFLGPGGLVNRLIGVEVPWLQSTEWSKPAVIANGAWRWVGYWMVMFLAGLQSIPDELYAAAAIDGANAWRRFVHVTFPLMRPVTLFVFVVNTMGTLQIFAEPYVMFGAASPGGPKDSATTPVLELFKYAFIQFNLGAGAALGWLLALVIIAFTLLQMSLARRRGWTE
jgi:ABC-type sugar transport system permease subunit